MSGVKGCLFDFNGTLFFDSHLQMESFRRYFASHGYAVPTDDFMVHNIFGRPNDRIVRENFDPDPSKETIEAFVNAKESLYYGLCLERPEEFRLIDGASDMLDYLKEKRVPFCLATGSGLENVEFYIKHLSIDKWFGKGNLVYNDGTYPGKPAPDIYRIAAKRLGLLPEECVVFEDGPSGMIAAKEAGVKNIVAVHDKSIETPIPEGIEPIAILHSLDTWRDILSSLGI